MSADEDTTHWVWFEDDVGVLGLCGSDPVTYEGKEVPLSTVPRGGFVQTYSMYGSEMRGVVGPPPSSVVFRVEVWKDGVKPLEMQEAIRSALDEALVHTDAEKVTVKIEYCFVPSGPRPVVPSEPV